jgi:uncharacterized protein
MKVHVQVLTEEEIIFRGIRQWPLWTKEKSEFDWYYDSQEQCLFLEGHVIIETPDDSVEICQGDFVTFDEGLECVWKVLEPVKKHYKFG